MGESAVLKAQRLGRIVDRYCLNPQSAVQTWNVIVEIEGPPLDYRPGDSMGVWPVNQASVVAELLSYFQLKPDDVILEAQRPVPVGRWFSSSVEVTRVTMPQIERLALAAHQSQDRERLSALLQQPLFPCDCRTFLRQYVPGGVSLFDIADVFPKMTPRLYSVASSSFVHPQKVELTVTRVVYEVAGHHWHGACSHYLTEGAPLNHPLPFFFQRTPHFTFPSTDQPCIMVAAGAGIAPFRALMQEVEMGVRNLSRCWLFFGGRQRNFDFFYEDFWRRLEQSHCLKLDLAFSRDQEQKVYVQHKMWERRQELWQWISERAIIFVCGSAKKMAKDVDRCLADIAATVGGVEDPLHWLRTMHHEGRYLRDIY